jgi:hypothetical protein
MVYSLVIANEREIMQTTENIITEWELETRYNEMLDECYGTVTIAGMEYETSRALKDTDPIAYRVGMHDYADSLVTEGDIDGWN